MWLIPAHHAEEYSDDLFAMAENPTTGCDERVRRRSEGSVCLTSVATSSYQMLEVFSRYVMYSALTELSGLDDYGT